MIDIRYNTRYLLIETVKDDIEMFYGYQANIAMAFVDAHHCAVVEKGAPLNSVEIRNVANEAAKNFIDLWTRKG